MAFHMTLGRGLGAMVGLIGFYQVFKEISEAIKSTGLTKSKFTPPQL